MARENMKSDYFVPFVTCCRAIAVCLVLILAPLSTVRAADYPTWWRTRGVVEANAPVNDFAIVTQGQLKNMAKRACEEFNVKLPGGAGSAVNTLVSTFTQDNNYKAANVGQLKNLAKPFYDRLRALGYYIPYPWAGTTGSDYAIANVGQAKNLFSFGGDTDKDGVPDYWEMVYFCNLASCNLVEYNSGFNPVTRGTIGIGITYPGLELYVQRVVPNLTSEPGASYASGILVYEATVIVYNWCQGYGQLYLTKSPTLPVGWAMHGLNMSINGRSVDLSQAYANGLDVTDYASGSDGVVTVRLFSNGSGPFSTEEIFMGWWYPSLNITLPEDPLNVSGDAQIEQGETKVGVISPGSGSPYSSSRSICLELTAPQWTDGGRILFASSGSSTIMNLIFGGPAAGTSFTYTGDVLGDTAIVASTYPDCVERQRASVTVVLPTAKPNISVVHAISGGSGWCDGCSVSYLSGSVTLNAPNGTLGKLVVTGPNNFKFENDSVGPVESGTIAVTYKVFTPPSMPGVYSATWTVNKFPYSIDATPIGLPAEVVIKKTDSGGTSTEDIPKIVSAPFYVKLSHDNASSSCQKSKISSCTVTPDDPSGNASAIAPHTAGNSSDYYLINPGTFLCNYTVIAKMQGGPCAKDHLAVFKVVANVDLDIRETAQPQNRVGRDDPRILARVRNRILVWANNGADTITFDLVKPPGITGPVWIQIEDQSGLNSGMPHFERLDAESTSFTYTVRGDNLNVDLLVRYGTDLNLDNTLAGAEIVGTYEVYGVTSGEYMAARVEYNTIYLPLALYDMADQLHKRFANGSFVNPPWPQGDFRPTTTSGNATLSAERFTHYFGANFSDAGFVNRAGRMYYAATVTVPIYHYANTSTGSTLIRESSGLKDGLDDFVSHLSYTAVAGVYAASSGGATRSLTFSLDGASFQFGAAGSFGLGGVGVSSGSPYSSAGSITLQVTLNGVNYQIGTAATVDLTLNDNFDFDYFTTGWVANSTDSSKMAGIIQNGFGKAGSVANAGQIGLVDVKIDGAVELSGRTITP